jgi:hypothetical protein
MSRINTFLQVNIQKDLRGSGSECINGWYTQFMAQEKYGQAELPEMNDLLQQFLPEVRL